MLTKKEISESLSLSCVESYFLAWLKRYYNVRNLYGNSFVSLGQVFDDFAHGATYQNYCYIPRLQDVAEEYGIVEHEFINCSAQNAIEIIKEQDENQLCMIRVNGAFFLGFKRSSWREDHYVCVDKELKWINEYPLSEGEFEKEQFCKIFDGAVLKYSIKDKEIIPPDFSTDGLKNQCFTMDDLPHSLRDMESAIGVLRVTRKRLEKYYWENVTICSVLRDENRLLDKLYFDVHLRHLKENAGEVIDRKKVYGELKEKLEFIIQAERRISEILK